MEALTPDLHKNGRSAGRPLIHWWDSGTSPIVPALNLLGLFCSQSLPEPDPLTFLIANSNSYLAQVDSVSHTDFQSSYVALIGMYMVGRCHFFLFPLPLCAYLGSRILLSSYHPMSHFPAPHPCCLLTCVPHFSAASLSSANGSFLPLRPAVDWFFNYRILIIYCMSVVRPWIFAHGWHKWFISHIYSYYDDRVTIHGKVNLSIKLVKNTFINAHSRWWNVIIILIKCKSSWSSSDLGSS